MEFQVAVFWVVTMCSDVLGYHAASTFTMKMEAPKHCVPTTIPELLPNYALIFFFRFANNSWTIPSRYIRELSILLVGTDLVPNGEPYMYVTLVMKSPATVCRSQHNSGERRRKSWFLTETDKSERREKSGMITLNWILWNRFLCKVNLFKLPQN
jgi:hypothetical protein